MTDISYDLSRTTSALTSLFNKINARLSSVEDCYDDAQKLDQKRSDELAAIREQQATLLTLTDKSALPSRALTLLLARPKAGRNLTVLCPHCDELCAYSLK